MILLCGVLISPTLVSCVTQKKKSDQGGLSMFYHNMNSKFNGYFNANELVEESIVQLESQYADNYIDLLEIYKYRAAANPEAVAASLDEAIKKVSVVATIHDNADWVDDCYLLIGKCFYLKQDFESAQNALEFFMDEFEPDGSRAANSKARKNAKKRKSTVDKERKERQKDSRKRAKEAEKERKKYNKQLKKEQKRQRKNASKKKGSKTKSDEKKTGGEDVIVSKRNLPQESAPIPEKEKQEKDLEAKEQNPGGLKHRPAYQEAQLWLAKTYVERELYPRAEYHLNSLANNPYLQDEVAAMLPAAQAYYLIRRENYKGAIPYLEQAIEVSKKKREKGRYAFIIAQIMELENPNSGEAYAYYEEVLRHAQDYELEFNAKMSMARTAFFSGNASVEESKQLLEKMIRDDKNIDYLDRIYFTYARLYLLQNDETSALAYLNEAGRYTGSNPPLQTEIFHLMGTLYFEKGMYVEAKDAFDRALQTMRKDDERYAQTELLATNLTDIAKHVQIITLQDSLLKISGMSEDDRRALAKELKKQQAAGYASSSQGLGDGAPTGAKGAKGNSTNPLAASQATAGGPPVRQVTTVNTGQSKFFAYDDKAVRRGEREFFRSWGGRPLVDNWRVSAKIDESGGVTIADTKEGTVTDVVTDEDLETIFRDVPSSPEEIAQSEALIQESMLQLGYLYRERMEDPQQSVDVLHELLNKYPDTNKRIEAYYELYLSYLMLNDAANSNKYKDKIINEFPGTKFALALSDPDYLSKQVAEEKRLEMHYDSVYAMVNNDQYDEAFATILTGKSKFGTNHEYYPRIAILEAMCTGHIEGKDAYIDALKHIVATYPNTPEETKARDMLLLLGEYQGNKLKLSTGGGDSDVFRVQPNTVHYLMVMINNYDEINSKDAKVSISDYNRKYHQLDRLKISSLVFDPKTGQSVILVRSFKNAEESMDYFSNAEKHADEFLPSNVDYEMLPVSQYNYREIIKQRSIDNYRDFFQVNY